jgi:hypothetical protein
MSRLSEHTLRTARLVSIRSDPEIITAQALRTLDRREIRQGKPFQMLA